MKTAEEILHLECDPFYQSLPDINKAEFLSAMHQHSEQVSEERSVKFAEWVESLPKTKRMTVWPPAGSGAGHGLYEKSMSDLYNEFITSQLERK